MKKSESEEQTLEQLLASLEISNWDFLIVGDGSGSNWDREAAWTSVSIERVTGERIVWYGGLNRGTVNFAEIMAYIQPLNWLVTREEDRRRKNRKPRVQRIHIITDSDYCRQVGNRKDKNVTKNAALWAVFDVFVRQGLCIEWHWLRRNACDLNTYCDQLSKLARRNMKKERLQENAEDLSQKTIYDINVSDVDIV